MSVQCRRLLWLLLTVVGLVASAAVSAQEPKDATETPEVATAPVVIDGATLFHVRGVSSFPAGARARGIEDRVKAVAADRTIAPDSLHIAETGSFTRILAGNVPIVTVVDADADLEQIGRPELAASHLQRIRQAITDYRAARSPAALQRAAVNALTATLLLAVVSLVLRWLWRAVDRLLKRRLQARIHTVEFHSFEVMRAEQIWQALQNVLFVGRTIVVVGLGLVYLGFLLGQFPLTRGLSQNMLGFALGPVEVIGNGIVNHIPSLVFLVVLFFLVRVVLRFLRLFFEAVGQGTVRLASFDSDWAEPTYKIVRIAVVAFALVVAYPYIPGSGSAAFQGVSLFLGIVFSLGSSSAISNIVAGYMMTYRRALKVGDRVKIGDAVGDVIETRLQVTHLRSFKNEEIIIPNSQILGGDVINYSSLARAHGLILHTEVGIGYETPWRQVEAMLLEAAQRTAGLSDTPPPFVLVKRLGDFAVTYELNVYCGNVPAMNQLYTQLHRQILDVFNEYGVQIMTPAYEADPEQPKIVPPKDWFMAPAVEPKAQHTDRDTSLAT
jgi:small-conductance mechanosensitive channel